MSVAIPDINVKPTDSAMLDGHAAIEELPVIDLSVYLNKDNMDSELLSEEATKVALCLNQYGVLVVKDPVSSLWRQLSLIFYTRKSVYILLFSSTIRTHKNEYKGIFTVFLK